MRTANPSTSTGRDPDQTGRARIRDAAINRFADDGVDGTSIRAIAADAGVSPALVMHHFGSKDGLRIACDEHVAATIRARKQEFMQSGGGLDPLAMMREAREYPPMLRYLARALADGSPEVNDLVDALVNDAEEYIEQAVASGLMKPSGHPRGRTVVLTMWSLGALVLHEHMARLLGADITRSTDDMAAYALPAMEILTRGVMADDFSERVRDVFAAADTQESEK